MAAALEVTSHLSIKVKGQELAAAIVPQVLEVKVEQHAYLPGMFTIRLQDPGVKLLDDSVFDLANEVEIAGFDKEKKRILLIKGEITALEPEFDENMLAQLTVRGYDKSHRLYRKIHSKTYQNIKDSDLATQFASNAGLQTDIETTKTVYEHLYQHNQSDLNFLRQRARRIGYECFVDDGKLVFRNPTGSKVSATLKWGEDLLNFQPRMTLAEQVEEVEVRGWDIQKKAEIIGRAQQGKLYPKLQNGAEGGKLTQSLGSQSKVVIVDQPVVSQAEADILAAAKLDELSGIFVESEGIAFRRPDVRAGQKIKIEGVGKRLSGDYFITSATHTYSTDGFKSYFHASGSRSGLLSEQMIPQDDLDRWTGAVPAIVTNTDDPKKWGRVKLKYPWMDTEQESDWARVVSIGGGPEAGFCVIPAVDDEVLVTFLHGDFGQPIVMGGVWNGKDAIPAPTADAPEREKPLVRTWRSRTGHILVMHDNAENKIEILSKDKRQLLIDDKGKKIVCTDADGNSITIDSSGKKISIESKGEVTISAAQNLTVKAGGDLELTASGSVTIKGTPINLN